ncbi:MAG: type III-A CRISPR-associated protein Csm2 [Clostridiales bacterium]|nr:type III-A CRISPR-associated protein Csm2 [Clostridiales bacterium]
MGFNQDGYRNRNGGDFRGGRNDRGGFSGDRRGNDYSDRSRSSHEGNLSYKVELEKITEIGYVEEAEKVIESIPKKKLLSTSKIRGILSLVSDLNDKLRLDPALPVKEIKEDCGYIRMRFAYESGREEKVRILVDNANLMGFLKQIGSADLDDETVRSKALLFCKYVEALVAYHKYCGGSDK